MIKKIQPQSFLSLGPEHYLTPRVLTTCVLKVAHAPGLRAAKMQAGSLRYLWALFIRASFFCHSDRSEARWGGAQCSGGISYTPDFRKAVRASPLLSFRPERSAVEESLYTRDFRKAVRASPLLSFRPERSVVEKSLGAPEFREAIRA